MANACSALTKKILENFVGKYDYLYCKTEAMTEKERGCPSDKEELSVLRASCSNQLAEKSLPNCSKGKLLRSNSHGGKVVLRACEVKEINERLQILEEESEIMKEAFLGRMEERKKLMNEIYQQLQILRRHLRNKPTGEECRYGGSIINPSKDGRMETGLLQVLCQDSNPSLVTRDLRVNMSAFKEPAEAMPEFSHT